MATASTIETKIWQLLILKVHLDFVLSIFQLCIYLQWFCDINFHQEFNVSPLFAPYFNCYYVQQSSQFLCNFQFFFLSFPLTSNVLKYPELGSTLVKVEIVQRSNPPPLSIPSVPEGFCQKFMACLAVLSLYPLFSRRQTGRYLLQHDHFIESLLSPQFHHSISSS